MNLSRRTYLRALGVLPGISLTGLSSESAAAESTDFSWGEPVLTGSTRVPVDDPHITLGHGVGYTRGENSPTPKLTRPELATEVLKLHPDFWSQRYITGMAGDPFYFTLSVPSVAREGIDLAATLGLPASLGFAWMPRDVPLEERPSEQGISGYLYDLPPEEQWPAPDGKPSDRPLYESTAREVEGNVREYIPIGNTAAYDVSMYAPGPTEYHLSNQEKAPLYGANATEMDLASDVSYNLKGDYSIWAKRAFREYLKDLPSHRLKRLGIDDISKFDIQTYAQNLRDDVYSGKQTEEDVIQDPVLFEFHLMEHRRILDFYETYVERGQASAEKVDSPLTSFGNQQSHIVDSSSNATIILSQVFDLIEMEEMITIPGHEADKEWTYLPGITTSLNKRAAALSQAVDKPVVEIGFMGDWQLRSEEFDFTKRYPTLLTINLAESYANGSTWQIELDGNNTREQDRVTLLWLNPETSSIPTDLRSVADFLWLYENDLRGKPQSDVAVIYSIPTMLAKIRSTVGRQGVEEAKSLDGWIRAARERQIPTDMVIFGHPEIWDDSNALNRLSDYQTVIFPKVSALTDAQYEAIREFVNNGGNVLYEGEIGTHDGYYRSRTDDIADLKNVNYVAEAGTKATDGDITAAGDAIEESLDSPLVKVDGTSTLSCEVIEAAEDSWKNVHLVNYNYDLGSDTIKEATNISVSLRDPEKSVQEVDFIAPHKERKSLVAERSGEYISVTVPEMAVWGIVRFKTSTRESTANESEANEAIEKASAEIDEVSDTGRSVPIARGEAAIYEAELARDAEQFDRAIEKANEAKEQTTPAKKELHIGIDSGHGQDPDRTYDGLAEFRKKYSAKYEISFSEVTAFTPEQLAGLDGLLIGPAFGYKGQSYTFSEKELTTLERFVDSGGRIGVVVSDAVDSAINSITERFDITVDPQMIYTLDLGNNNSAIRTEPAEYRTPLTYQILEEGWMPRACSLTNLGEDVAVQIQSKPNTVRKGSSEQKQYPVSAVSRPGKGAVVVHTSDKLFSELRYGHEVQARNILRFIGDSETKIEVDDLTSEQTNTHATTTEIESGSDSGTIASTMETDTDGSKTTRTTNPGFGIISTMIGFISTLIYAVYQRDEQKE